MQIQKNIIYYEMKGLCIETGHEILLLLLLLLFPKIKEYFRKNRLCKYCEN